MHNTVLVLQSALFILHCVLILCRHIASVAWYILIFLWIHACGFWKGAVKKKRCGNLGTCFWYKNIQLIAFANDEELFNRLIIIFITFDVVRNYYFFLDVPLTFLTSSFCIHTQSVENIYHNLHFYFIHKLLIKLFSCDVTNPILNWFKYFQ